MRITSRQVSPAGVIGPIVFLLVGLGAAASLHEAPSDIKSDKFWSALAVEGSQYTRFASLREMADFSSVVVVGRITAIENGRVFVGDPNDGERGKAYYLSATLAIDEVLDGQAVDRTAKTLVVELFASNRDAIPTIMADVPTEQSIFFLLNKAQHPATAGASAAQKKVEERYYEIIGDQALLRDIGGKVATRPELDPLDPIAKYEGLTFSDVVAEVRLLH